MHKSLLPIVLIVLFSSCASEPERSSPSQFETQQATFKPEPFTITDHKNSLAGGSIPEWVSLSLENSLRELEANVIYADRFVFVSRSEGSNFNALNNWNDKFSTELDFPRLAAARIEARFSSNVPNPDNEYGTFFEALIRASSDTAWTGAVREEDFWIRKKYTLEEDGLEALTGTALEAPTGAATERETWEFLILLTMEKSLFSSQLETVFENLNPNPPPSSGQAASANRVKERFFEGF